MSIPDPFPFLAKLVQPITDLIKYLSHKDRQEKDALTKIWVQVVIALGENDSPLTSNLNDKMLDDVDHVDNHDRAKYSGTSFGKGVLKPGLARRYRVSLLILALISHHLSRDQTTSFITAILDQCSFMVPQPDKDYLGDPYDDLYLERVVPRLVKDIMKPPKTAMGSLKKIFGSEWKDEEFNKNLETLRDDLTRNALVEDQHWTLVAMPKHKSAIALGPEGMEMLVPGNKEAQKVLSVLSRWMKTGHILDGSRGEGLDKCGDCNLQSTSIQVNSDMKGSKGVSGAIWHARIVSK